MTPEDLVDYIETQRQQGMPKDRIQAELIRAGWSIEAIQKAFLTKPSEIPQLEKSLASTIRERAVQPVDTRLSVLLVVILAAFLGGLLVYQYWYAPKYVWAQTPNTQAQALPQAPTTETSNE